MKKRCLAILLAAGMVLSMAGCKDKDDVAEEPAKGSQTDENGTEDADDTDDTVPPTVALQYIEKLAGYVTLGEYEGIEYEPYDTTVTDDDVINYLESSVASYGLLNKVDRAVKEGDYVYINFTGAIDGENDDNLSSGYQQTLKIGSGDYIEGFEEGLIGHKAEETVVLNLTFPDDYGNSDYASKDVVFTVELVAVNEMPELTDEFINTNFGDDSDNALGWDSLDAAKADIRQELEDAAKQTAESYDTQSILDSLVNDSTFTDLPQDYLDEYYDNYIDYYQQFADYYSMSLDDYCSIYGITVEELQSECEEMAQLSVEQDIALWAVAEAEGIELTDDEYENRVNEAFEEYKDIYSYTDASEFVENNGGEDTVKYRLRIIMAREWIVEKAVAVES